MTTKDLFITPLFIFLILAIAFWVRGRFTDEHTRKYFIPALLVRLFGAIAVGFIYQFYYGGGDTFNFHTHGSLHIWDALLERPAQGIKLLTASGGDHFEAFQYSSKIWYYRDPAGYLVVKITALFDLLTYGTYSATACLFAVLSFTGSWLLFSTFYRKYPGIHFYLALSILFIPSVFFWGSGIFKDTLSLAMMGVLIHSVDKLFIRNRWNFDSIFLMLLSSFIIYKIKIYQLLVVLPSLILWVLVSGIQKVRHVVLRILIAPVMIIIALGIGYVAVKEVGEAHPRYNIGKIAKTARITAYDIRYGWGARHGNGSGYDIGIPDGTFIGLLEMAPKAVNVTLFRPYLFEVNNPLMLFASLESTVILLLTLYIVFLIFTKRKALSALKNEEVLFCLIFAVAFAFAVGASTFNFGTLSRYKLPVLPVYLTALSIIYGYAKGMLGNRE